MSAHENSPRNWPSTIFVAVVIAALSGLIGHAIGYERAVVRVDNVTKDVNALQLALAAMQVEQVHMSNDRADILRAIDSMRAEMKALNEQLHEMRAKSYFKGGG